MAVIRVANQSGYPDAEVRQIVRSALGWGIHAKFTDQFKPFKLTVRVYRVPYTGAARAAYLKRSKEKEWVYGETKWGDYDRSAVTTINIGRPQDYPARTEEHGQKPVWVNSWQEDLYHTMAHEGWHLMHREPRDARERRAFEARAEARGVRRLSQYRWWHSGGGE